VRLFQSNGPAQASLERRDIGAQLVPIEREARFKAQRVARGQPHRQQAIGLAHFQQGPPDLQCIGRAQVKLKAILAGIARTGHERLNACHPGSEYLISAQGVQRQRRTLLQDVLRARALDCQHGRFR